MKHLLDKPTSAVSQKEILDLFIIKDKLERQKLVSQKKLMEEKLKRATKGRNIVISNFADLK